MTGTPTHRLHERGPNGKPAGAAEQSLPSYRICHAGPGRLLESRIAAGDVGQVRRGGDTAPGQAVAAKLLRAEHAGHSRRWPGAGVGHAAAFTHPGSPRVHDYRKDGQPCLVMELEGAPLEAETGHRTPVTDRSGVCQPAGTPTRYARPIGRRLDRLIECRTRRSARE